MVRKSSMAIGNTTLAEEIPACGKRWGLVKLIEVLSKISADYAPTSARPLRLSEWLTLDQKGSEIWNLEHLPDAEGHPFMNMASRSAAAVVPSTPTYYSGEYSNPQWINRLNALAVAPRARLMPFSSVFRKGGKGGGNG
jgi:hypothetical protein